MCLHFELSLNRIRPIIFPLIYEILFYVDIYFSNVHVPLKSLKIV